MEGDDERYQPYHQGGIVWNPPLVLTPEQERAKEEKEREHRRKFLRNRAESRVRGMLLGLAVGETLGAAGSKLPAGGPLRAGVSTQLACFTAEGTIRAMVRGKHKGICHPASVVWHAYCRWAALQGIEAERMRRRWAPYDTETAWPDGWLAQVSVLAERSGAAPRRRRWRRCRRSSRAPWSDRRRTAVATIFGHGRVPAVLARARQQSRPCSGCPFEAPAPGGIAWCVGLVAGVVATETEPRPVKRSALSHEGGEGGGPVDVIEFCAGWDQPVCLFEPFLQLDQVHLEEA